MYLLAQLDKALLQEQLVNGLLLTVIGMGIVFLFLTILVFTTKAVSAVVKKIEPEKKPVAKVENNDGEIAAAILAAVVKSKS